MDKRVAKVLQSSTVQLYFHCCVIDGVVSAADAGVRLHPALPQQWKYSCTVLDWSTLATRLSIKLSK